MVIDNLLYAGVGAVIGAVVIYVLEERSKQHSYELNHIYKPLREEFISIRKTGKDRLQAGNRYPWTPGEDYRKIKQRGDLLPKRFKYLGKDIVILEKTNKTLEQKSHELYESIESALENAMTEIEKEGSNNHIKSLILDDGLRRNLKEHLLWPLYFNLEDEAIHWLDLQKPEWRYYSQIPILKELIPTIRRKAEEEIAKKREEFFISRKQFFDKLEIIVMGLDKSIISSGRTKYRPQKFIKILKNS